MVRRLMAGRKGIPVKDITTARGEAPRAPKAPKAPSRPSRPGRMPPGARPPGKSPPSKKPKPAVEAGVTQVEPSKTPVTLVPHVSRNWIIAVAPAELIPQIKAWVKQLDKPREIEKDYELITVKYADVDRVAERIQQTLRSMPNAELRETTYAVPFAQAGKIIVFGAPSGR